MSETRSSKVRQVLSTLRYRMERHRRLRSLIRGRKRLMRWQRSMQFLLVEIRLLLQERPLGTSYHLQTALGLPVRPTTLPWALQLLEDLYLLLKATEELTLEEMSSMSKQP